MNTPESGVPEERPHRGGNRRPAILRQQKTIRMQSFDRVGNATRKESRYLGRTPEDPLTMQEFMRMAIDEKIERVERRDRKRA
jgi:hypothetical protein